MELSSLVAQVWDPVGVIAPVMIRLSIDLQELWSLGYSCDDILPGAIQQKWKINAEIINQLIASEFNRKIKPSKCSGNT